MTLGGAALGSGLNLMFNGLAAMGRLHPASRPSAHGLRRITNVPYTGTGSRAHLLDVVRPDDGQTGLPVVLYLHGGAFRILSKDTHYVASLMFGTRGAVVFNANYRLAPKHPFPAAIEDAAEALHWVVAHAAEYGGDAGRLVLAGESAGANLATALTVAACFDIDDPISQRLHAATIVPRVLLPAMGFLQVSDPERFQRRKQLPWALRNRILDAGTGYNPCGTSHPLCDPLLVYESDTQPNRPLPPMFAAAAIRDPILDDTRRLHAAAKRRGLDAEIAYGDGPHAFHFLLWRKDARAMWTRMLDFAQSRW